MKAVRKLRPGIFLCLTLFVSSSWDLAAEPERENPSPERHVLDEARAYIASSSAYWKSGRHEEASKACKAGLALGVLPSDLHDAWDEEQIERIAVGNEKKERSM